MIRGRDRDHDRYEDMDQTRTASYPLPLPAPPATSFVSAQDDRDRDRENDYYTHLRDDARGRHAPGLSERARFLRTDPETAPEPETEPPVCSGRTSSELRKVFPVKCREKRR